MFGRKNSEEPQLPLSVELFFESQMGRLVAEVDGVVTTPNRDHADVAVNLLERAMQVDEENQDGTTHEPTLLLIGAESSFIIDAVMQTIAGNYEQVPHGLKQIDTQLKATNGALGDLLMHGLKVQAWRKRTQPEKFSYSGMLTSFVTRELETIMGGRRDVKRLARFFLLVASPED